MRHLKIIPWAVGGCLLVWLLTGAKLVQSPPSPPPAPAKKPANDPLSMVQPGTVDTDERPVEYALPSTMPAATVAEVLVKEGAEVKPGQLLIRFDAELAKADLQKAESARAAALWQQKQAETAVANYNKTDQAKLAVLDAEDKLKSAKDGRDGLVRRIDEQNRTLVANNTITQAKADQNRKDDPQVVAAEAQVTQAERNVQAKKLLQTEAEAGLTILQEQAKTAAAAVKVTEADVAKARLVVDRCDLKAVAAGLVERVDAAPGQVVGPHTRSPLVYVVPAGPRVVRVEVVPDFAYRILQDKVGSKVSIADEHQPGNTYEGEVKRIPSVFLPRRGAGPDLLAGKPTKVLEVIIQVKDESPAGRPPLRVGQPVRVHFQ